MVGLIERGFGNPSSLHEFSDEPREAMEDARRKVAGLLNAEAREILFTSTGTESNNLAVKGIAAAYRRRGGHIVTSRVEHASVLLSCKTLEREGCQVTYLPVDRFGLVDPQDLKQALRPDTVLVTIQWANNEIGTLQPIRELARLTRERDIIFHTDAVAAVGRIPIDVESAGVDALSLAANQFYGPQGAAALYLRRGVRLTPLMEGGVQEGGRRAGSENVLSLAGMGLAAQLAADELEGRKDHLVRLHGRLASGLEDRLSRMLATGHPARRLPGHYSLCLEFVEGEALVRALSQAGVAAATGSACRDFTTRKISHVLEALGLDIRLAQGSLVLTIGKDNTEGEIDYALEAMPETVERLRSISPIYSEIAKAGSRPHA